jgi:predicted ATPase
VGNELEQLYEPRTEEVALELARHFQAAGLVEKAVEYLRQAGERARRLSAHDEAIAHLTRALALLVTLPDTPERALQEVRLQLDLGNVWIAVKGFAAPEAGQAYSRACALCRHVGETPQLYPVLQGLQRYYVMRGEFQTAREVGEEFLHLAQHQQNLAARLAAQAALGPTLYYLGELTAAREQLKQGVALYDLRQHRSLAFDYGTDPGVTCLFHEALTLWHLGYPEQALARSHQALSLAQDLSHPFTLAVALYQLALLYQLRRDEQAALAQAQATIIFSSEHDFPIWRATATIVQGWVLVGQGEMKEGISRICQGLDTCRNLGTAAGGAPGTTQYLSVLAEAYSKAGRPHEGLDVLAEAQATANGGGERMWAAELYRLKGELLLKDEGERPALPVLNEVEGPVLNEVDGMKAESPENCFLRALEIARRQQAKSLELRAVMSLCRLRQEQGKKEEARQMLAEIYGWFTEGFDTVDLREAKSLLDALSEAYRSVGEKGSSTN